MIRLLPLLLVAACASAPPRADLAERPNVVIVFTDDQGWADIGVQGAEGFTTPNIDRLAREGVSPACHLAVVNLSTGDVEHSLGIDGAVQELYDVTVLNGMCRPMVHGFRTPEIRFSVRPGPLTPL